MAAVGTTGKPGKKRAAKPAAARSADGLPAGKRLETKEEVQARYNESIQAARAELGHPAGVPAAAAAEAERTAHAAFDSTPLVIDA